MKRYKKNNPKDNKYFPKRSWIVEVIKTISGKVFHRVIEYDGKPRDGKIFMMDEDLFYENYTEIKDE